MAEQEADQGIEEVLDYNDGEQGAEQMEAAPDAGEAAQEQADAGQPAANGAAAEQAAAQDKPADEPAKDAAPRSLDPMSQPPHGTEVYMANLAMDATDDQIRDFCEKMGQVFQLRIPKNPDGRNRGYGFVVYSTKAAAENAVQHLNAQELPDFPGRKVRVSESQVKNRLYMGNLPRSMTQHQLEEALKQELQGVEDVELMMDKENPELNRGFGFITFYNYACAEAARRKYTEAERTLGGRPLTVTWAEPKKEEDTSKVKAIYVGNLPETVTEEKLRDVFKAYGEVEKVMLPYSKEDPTKYRDYGFVHFRERPSALQAIARAEEDKPAVDGKELSVAMAKPQHDNTQGGYGYGAGSYGRGYGAAAGGYGGYGAAAGGYGSYGYGAAGGRGRGSGAGYGRGAGAAGGRGYGAAAGRGRGGYGAAAAYGGYEEEGYGEEEEYGDEGYGAGGYSAAAAGYGAAAAGVASGGTMMVPVQLPTGQVGYMVVPAGAAVGGAGGPVRRGVAAAGYGAAGYGAAAGYAAGAAGAYGSGRGTGYGAGRGAGYGRGGTSYRSNPY